MLDNYGELCDSIAKELSRSDLKSSIPDWIFQAELYISRKAKLADGEQLETGALVVDQPYIQMPQGFKKPMHIEIQSNPLRILEHVSMAKRSDILENSTDARPLAVAFIGRRAYLAPVPTTTDAYDLFYYGLPAPLSEENPSNDLLELGADALKYTALMYSAPRLGADERLGMWRSIRDELVRDVAKEYWDSKVGIGVTRIRQDFAPSDRHR